MAPEARCVGRSASVLGFRQPLYNDLVHAVLQSRP